MGDQQPARGAQYACGLAANMGGFILGTIIGWSSPALDLIKDQIGCTDKDTSWISSIMPIGAASAQFFVAPLMDFCGRKVAMLTLAPLTFVGWILIVFANSMALYCVGRFITGVGGGGLCVVCPTYNSEFTDKDVRGRIGVLFQFFVVIGILLGFCLGEFKSLAAINYPLAVVPIAFTVMVIFMPESPVYHLTKGNMEKAQKTLQFFRGPNYNIDAELKDMIDYTKPSTESLGECFRKKSTLKAFFMLISQHFLQQLIGINVVMFFAHRIFQLAGSTLTAGISSIILGVVQVFATMVSAYCVDKVGRRILFFLSFLIMGICQVILGIYFLIKENNEDLAKTIAFLPLLCVCLYMVGFSLGAGPLPWAMLGELMPNRVKNITSCIAIFSNWMLAFLITSTFGYLVDAIGAYSVFWIYGAVCFVGIAYVIFVLIETKGKTLEQIQQIFTGGT